MLRVHRYVSVDADFPPHKDLGLLTIAPRASVAGLEIQRTSDGAWLPIEEQMGPSEALLFGGSTLEELGGPAALPHKVRQQGKLRLSAPYFLRASPDLTLPATTNLSGSAASTADGSAATADGSAVTADGSAVTADGSASSADGSASGTQGTTSVQASSSEQLEPLTTATTGQPSAAPPPDGGSGGQRVSDFVARKIRERQQGAPERVRHAFFTLDTDRDGRLTRTEVLEGLGRELGTLPEHTIEQLCTLFDQMAIGDAHFPEPYVDGMRFNRLYAEMLYAKYASVGVGGGVDGLLSYDAAQRALTFLTRAPKDGSPKPLVHLPLPQGTAADSAANLRITPYYFGVLYRGMP